MIANKYNSASGVPVGSLTGQESTLSFMNNIKSMISKGALTATGGVLSLASLGIDLQRDGTLKFNSTNYSSEIAKGLLEKLKTGISIGGVTGSSANLSSNLASIINPMGTIDSAIQNQNKQIDTTNVRVNNLNNQLKELEKSYISRFSSLNALLFKLNDTSNQLTNSLTAVTNINKGTN
jgi:flagellar hook-associated protein 2